MLESFEGIAVVQHLTIYSFMMTTVVYAWTAASMTIISSVLLSTLVIGCTYIMYMQTTIVERAFPMRSIALVSGAFFPSQAQRQAQAAAHAAIRQGTDDGAYQQQERQPPPQPLPPPGAGAPPGMLTDVDGRMD